MQRRLLLALVLMLTLLACTEANAAPFNYSGTTVGGPTWNRSLPGTPPTGLSGVGTSVPYDEFAFTVDASGAYNFLSLGVTPTNWDNFLALYQTAFSPLSPLTSFAEVMQCDRERFNRFFHEMLARGVYLAPSAYQAGFVSAAHGAREIDETLAAAREAFRKG